MGDLNKRVIVVNSKMVQMFMDLFDDYSVFSLSLPPFVLSENLGGCKHLHSLMFVFEEDRETAWHQFEQYSKDKKVQHRWFYRGEMVTREKILELIAARGDFGVWEKYFNE